MTTYNNTKALSKIKPSRSVFDVEQRSRSIFTTRGQGQCVVLYYLEVQWKSVTQTARQINVFISYSKYIILDEHLEIWFSVYVVQCTLYPTLIFHSNLGSRQHVLLVGGFSILRTGQIKVRLENHPKQNLKNWCRTNSSVKRQLIDYFSLCHVNPCLTISLLQPTVIIQMLTTTPFRMYRTNIDSR